MSTRRTRGRRLARRNVVHHETADHGSRRMLRRYRCYVHYAGARSDPLFTTHDSLCALILYCFCHFIVREAGNNRNATLRFPPPARDIEMCDNFPDLDVRKPLLYTVPLPYRCHSSGEEFQEFSKHITKPL